MRLKTDTVANDSIRALVQGTQAPYTTLDAFAYHAELWNTGCHTIPFMAVVVAWLVVGIVATALAPSVL